MATTLMVKQLPGFLIHPDLKPHYRDDAGIDLYNCASIPVAILPRGFAEIQCGIAIKLPPGVWGEIRPRSSTFWKRRLMVAPGTIDNGYTGPIYIGIWNPTDEIKYVAPMESLAQLVFHQLVIPEQVVRVEVLPDTLRGVSGFGSTGGIVGGNS